MTATAAGCYNSTEIPPIHTPTHPAVTTTLAELHARYLGQIVPIREDLVLTGQVTSSDAAGNFYRSFLIQSDDAAAEVMAGIDETHSRYPIGCQVTLRLQGTAIGENHGVLQIGRMPAPYGNQVVESFYSQALLDQIITRGTPLQPIVPQEFCLSNPELSRCGCLVFVTHLSYLPEIENEEATWSGYKRFEDPEGNVMYTYTSPYARFASHPIPTGEVSFIGILQFGKAGSSASGYILKMRDENDCLL
ncbi:MAG: DUF5689 domain-containing protein [Alistipes sp.]